MVAQLDADHNSMAIRKILGGRVVLDAENCVKALEVLNRQLARG
jgi:hypothetical protein